MTSLIKKQVYFKVPITDMYPWIIWELVTDPIFANHWPISLCGLYSLYLYDNLFPSTYNTEGYAACSQLPISFYRLYSLCSNACCILVG